MKVKIIKNVTVFEGELVEGEILDIITIAVDPDDNGVDIILERNGKAYDAYFKDLHDANEHIEFDYKEEMNITEVYITENESNRRVAEVYDEQQKKIEYWKSKCMKLIEMI